MTPETLIQFAATLGLDRARFATCMESDEVADKLERNRQEADALGVRGTPTFFLNNQVFRGRQPAREFEISIRQMVKELNRRGVDHGNDR